MINEEQEDGELYTEEVVRPETEGAGVALEDFVVLPDNTYMFLPCRTTWARTFINSQLPRQMVCDASGQPKKDGKGKPVTMLATTWIDNNSAVHGLTWAPGLPLFINDKMAVAGGWIERKEMRVLNLYRPPRLTLGDAALAGPWVDHIHAIYPEDGEHIIRWLAHHAQNPGNKVNHALVLGGEPNIGKDTILAPMKDIIGHENFQDIRPSELLGRFNGFVKTVLLRLNEAHDLGETDRFKFYDRIKILTASPPEVLRVDEKHQREYYVANCLGMVMTTNHKSDGLYLLPNDRRHYVAWSGCTSSDFGPEYFNKLHAWYQDGGTGHVGAYLMELDLTGFNPKAPPRKTAAFWDIVNANVSPEDIELLDAIDRLGEPDALLMEQVRAASPTAALDWMLDMRARRSIPHRMERCGYVPVPNPNDKKHGHWRHHFRRLVVYARSSLNRREQLGAAEKLLKTLPK